MVYTLLFRRGTAPPLKKYQLPNWPLYASAATFLLLVWIVLNVSLSANRGNLVYALDDPYIHMAMAKNFSQFGIWGVTRYEYTSASSSPLWTLLISLTYYLAGVNPLAPLIWNVLFALLILAAAHGILCWYKLGPAVRFCVLLGIILLVPLPMFVLAGMEIGLQTLVTLLFVFVAARVLSGESPGSARRDSLGLLILAPLVTAVRFEGIFLILGVVALFLLLKSWRYAAGLAVCGSLPVLINGGIAVSHGWFWFPNSVLLKATLPDFRASPGEFAFSLFNPVWVTIRNSPHVLTLLVTILLLYIVAYGKGSGWRESRQLMTAILFLLGMAHLEFLGGAPLYRYDAYWNVLAILLIGLQLPVVMPNPPPLNSLRTLLEPRHLACGALMILLLLPILEKGWRLLWYLPECSHDVFEQQYQMGLFVQKYYHDSAVGLNDIGAVNYLADIHCLDLWGLANVQVAAAKRRNGYDSEEIDRISRRAGARIAIIYDNWFVGVIPPAWTRVGRWAIRDNVVLGGDTVSFYALSAGEIEYLRRSLTDFAPRVPVEVIQERGN